MGQILNQPCLLPNTDTCCTTAYPEAAHQDKAQCLQRLLSHRVMLQTTSKNPVDWLHTTSREPSSTSQRGRGHICDEPNTQFHGSTQTRILLASSNKERGRTAKSVTSGRITWSPRHIASGQGVPGCGPGALETIRRRRSRSRAYVCVSHWHSTATNQLDAIFDQLFAAPVVMLPLRNR